MTPRLRAALDGWASWIEAEGNTMLCDPQQVLYESIVAEFAPRETWTVLFEMKLVNELNQRPGHWSGISAPRKVKRTATHAHVLRSLAIHPVAKLWPAYDIKIIRISPKKFDDDGMQAAAKSVRDGIADALKFRDDSDPRLSWSYAQERGGIKSHLVRIEITRREM
jgi:hypothetical protein